jgi:hypothetical protein
MGQGPAILGDREKLALPPAAVYLAAIGRFLDRTAMEVLP